MSQGGRADGAARCARDLRDNGRPRPCDDLPLALPARGTRAPRLPDRRRRRSTTGRSSNSSSTHESRSSRPVRSSTKTSSAKFAKRLSYVHGDFTDAATYAQVAEAVGDAKQPVFYLEIPPSLFGTVVGGTGQGGAHREREGRRREAVRPRPRFGARAQRRAACAHRRVAALPDRPLPRKDGGRGHPLPAFREHDPRARLEPAVRLERADNDGRDFGIADRGHFYDPVGAMRDVVQNHLLQVLSLVAMEPPTGRGEDVDQQPQAGRVRGDGRGRPCALRARAVRRATSTSTASRPARRRRRSARCGSRSTTGAGRACRSSSAQASRCPETVTEVRVVFNTTPWLGFVPKDAPRPEANQLVLRIGPSPGARLRMQAKDAERDGAALGSARHGVRRVRRRGTDAVRGVARSCDAGRLEPLSRARTRSRRHGASSSL